MAKVTLKQKAYSHIKGKIINCELEPGTYLDEKKIIDELDMSRTPIREALTRIEDEGYIKIIPKKGIFITQITMKNILQVFQVREVIEPAALSKYGQNLSMEKIFQFKDRYSRKTFSEEEANLLDDEFHKFLISAYNNKYMTDLYEEITEQNHRVRVMSGKMGNSIDVTYNEHLYILNYLENLQMEKASVALHDHIQATKRRILERIF
ncbi:MAG: GntR family transcriptional regulator [Lachnospirales bacterium]